MQARSELSETFSATDVAKKLEARLSEIDEPVDLVLARFATEGV
jgi:pheromone shutdown protein TraB